MENVSLKLDKPMARQIEKGMREFNYSTKTEFIRDSIRGKLKELEKERAEKKAWDALFALRGSLKGKGRFKTDEEFYAWRAGEGSRLLEEKLSKELGLKP